MQQRALRREKGKEFQEGRETGEIEGGKVKGMCASRSTKETRGERGGHKHERTNRLTFDTWLTPEEVLKASAKRSEETYQKHG
jgi:hypothetical protein